MTFNLFCRREEAETLESRRDDLLPHRFSCPNADIPALALWRWWPLAAGTAAGMPGCPPGQRELF